MNAFYNRSHEGVSSPQVVDLSGYWVALVLIVVLWNTIPAEMAPLEDRSQIMDPDFYPEGATFEFTRDYTEGISRIADSVAWERESNITIDQGYFGMVRLVLPGH